MLPTVDLAAFGLAPSDPVRFRRAERGRWQPGTLEGLSRSGDALVRDAAGAPCSVPPTQVQVVAPPRPHDGTVRWQRLADRLLHPGEQLELF